MISLKMKFRKTSDEKTYREMNLLSELVYAQFSLLKDRPSFIREIGHESNEIHAPKNFLRKKIN